MRLWDRDPLLQTFGQLQEIRTYYDFVSVDDDRYWIDGKYRQVLLSPRELNVRSLPTRTFINEHLTFTHGMGLTMSPVNQVTIEGLPVLFIKDLPPVSHRVAQGEPPAAVLRRIGQRLRLRGYPAARVRSPFGREERLRLLRGEGRSASPEPSPSGGARGAVRVFQDPLLRRHHRFQPGALQPGHRSAGPEGAPLLSFDRDPYLVVANDGTLKWILDAYTSTTRYPYAERLRNGISYMRNSSQAGDRRLRRHPDGLRERAGRSHIRTWSRVFPGIFAPLDRMPADIRAHIRYPDQIYRIQAGLYTTYHMDDPVDFYHREDQWQIPEAVGG